MGQAIFILETWVPFWPTNIDKCKEYHNLRKFYEFIRLNNYILVMGVKWGEIAVKPNGEIVAYFTPPKPIHNLSRENNDKYSNASIH